MTVQDNGKSTGLGGVTGKGFRPGQSGNPGGRPKGLATLAREAVGGGRDLIDFYVAVFKGDTKALRVRKITLRDQFQAAEWLAERGWGRAPIVVDLPDEPQASEGQDFVEWAKRLPPDLRKALGEHMDREFEAGSRQISPWSTSRLRRRCPKVGPHRVQSSRRMGRRSDL